MAYVRSRFLIADQVISVLSNHVVSLCLVRSLFDAMTVSPALTRRRRPVFRRRAFSSLFSFQGQPPEGTWSQDDVFLAVHPYLPTIDSHSPLYPVMDTGHRVLIILFFFPLTASYGRNRRGCGRGLLLGSTLFSNTYDRDERRQMRRRGDRHSTQGLARNPSCALTFHAP